MLFLPKKRIAFPPRTAVASFLLLGGVLAGVLTGTLSSCRPAEGGDPTPTPDNTVWIEIATSEDCPYTVVRPDKAEETEITAAQTLRFAIIEALGCEVKLGDDFVRAGKVEEKPLEILVGHTNRAASQAFIEELGAGDYGFAYLDGKLVICGATPEMTLEAVNLFIETYLKGNAMKSLQVPDNLHSITSALADYSWLSSGDAGVNVHRFDTGAYVSDWTTGESYVTEPLLSPTGRTGTVTGDTYDYNARTGDYEVKRTDKLTDGLEEYNNQGMALWSGTKKDTATDTYINYDFGEPYYISYYKLRPSMEGMHWDLEYSEDGENWEIADSYSEGGWIHHRTFGTPILAQYVRFHITQGSIAGGEFYIAIREIWMQGVAASSLDGEPTYIPNELQYDLNNEKHDYEYYYDYDRAFLFMDLGADCDVASYEVSGYDGQDVKCYFSSAAHATVWQAKKTGGTASFTESGRRYMLFSFPAGTNLQSVSVKVLARQCGNEPVRTLETGEDTTAFVMPTAAEGVTCTDLDGTWEYTGEPAANFFGKADTSEWGKIQVPAYPSTQGFASVTSFTGEYNHEVAYRRTVPSPLTDSADRYFLRFDSVLNVARVWVNGQFLGAHTGGYCAFEYEITDIVKTGEDLEIVVGATYVSYAPELNIGDGGITGDVTLIATKDAHLTRLTPCTVFDKQYKNAELLLSLDADAGKSLSGTLTLTAPDGKTVAAKQNVTVAADTHTALRIPVSAPEKWDAEHPRLYTLTLQFTNGLTYEQKIGFRSVEVCGSELLVNGESVTLRGVDWTNIDPTAGLVSSYESDRESLIKLKQANVNYIRTAHFAPSDRILDLMDELGFYVELESTQHINTHWTSSDYERIDTLNNPAYRDWTLGVYRAVYERTARHTSIVIWSTSNESDFGDNAKSVCLYLRSVDSRPIKYSWGYDIPADADYIDIKSSHYPAYDALTSDTTMPTVYDEYAHLYWKHGVDAGYRALYGVPLRTYWEAILDQEGGLGGAIWQSRDFMFFGLSGTFSFNDTWGLLDAWNREKPEYYSVKKVYSPLYLEELQTLYPSADGVTVAVENRYDHTFLDEIVCVWSCGDETGEFTLPGIAPHESGVLTIPVKNAGEGDTLHLSFVRRQYETVEEYIVNTYEYVLGGWVAPTYEGAASGAAPTLTDGSTVTVTGTDFTVTVRKSDFTLVATREGKRLLDGIPTLTLNGVLQTGLRISSVTAGTEGSEAVITMKGNYDGVRDAAITLRIDSTGRLNFTFGFTKKTDYDEIGLYISLNEDISSLSWNARPTLWNYYPDTDIARLSGTAPRNYDVTETYRIKPAHPWICDASSFDTGMGDRLAASRDFISTRYGVDTSALSGAAGSVNLEADFVGLRLSVEEDGKVGMTVAPDYTVQGAQERDFLYTHESDGNGLHYTASFTLRLSE